MAPRLVTRAALTISLFATLLIPSVPTVADAQTTPQAKIVFARNPGSIGGGLYVINADGTGETLVNPFGDNPTWSPDGSKIAFDVNGDLYVMNADGTNRTNITESNDSFFTFPDWSPDGSKLVFSGAADGGAYDLYTSSPDGTGITNLTNSGGPENRPDWSEDGTQITFETQAGGMDFEIYTMDADGTNAQAVTNNTVADRDPNWSSQDEIAWGYNDLELRVADSDGTNSRSVTNATDDQSPSWSSDGNALVFSSSREGSYDLFILSGGVVTRVTTAPEHDLRADFFGNFGSTVAQHSLEVTPSGSGTGNVTSAPAGIACGSTCSADFDEDAEVTLTADPDVGSEFTGWTGDCVATDLECTVTMDEAKSVTATFATANHLLSVTLGGSGAGEVTSDPTGIGCGTDCSQTYVHGTPVTLTAEPATGSTFAGWTGACGGNATTCIVPMTQARSVGATFNLEAPPPDPSGPTPASASLTVFKLGTAPGSLSVNGQECSSSCTYVFPYGSLVTIGAVPGEASKYTWTGCESVSGTTCTTTLAGDRSVSAEFVRMTVEEFARDAQGRGRSCLEIGTDVARIYNSTPTTVARVLNSLRCTVLEVSEYLQGRAGMGFDRAATVLRNVGYGVTQIAHAGVEVFRLLPRQVGGVLKDLGFGVSAIGTALRDGVGASIRTAGRVLLDLFPTDAVARVLRDTFDGDGGGIARLFVELGVAPAAVAKALANVFTGASIGGIGRWLRDAGLGPAEIGRALKNGLSATASRVASVLQNIGFDEFAIGGVLKNVFSRTPTEIGRLLKGLGYGAGEIASVLKDRLGLAAERVADVLYNGVGYGLEAVGRAVRSTFNVGIDGMARIMEGVGAAASNVARALGDIYNASSSRVASALDAAGYGLVEMARAIKNVFGLGYNALYNLMRSLGFSISAIIDALEDLF